MNAGDSETDSRVVTWMAIPDRDTDRFRLTVWHLAVGIPVIIGVLVLGLLAFVVADGLAGGNMRTILLVIVLAFIGGPASLVYLLFGSELGSRREITKLTPSIGSFRLRYIPISLLGGGFLLLSSVIQPVLFIVYLIGFFACKVAINVRYTVGQINIETATLRQVTGPAAVEYTDENLDTNDVRVRAFDLAPLKSISHRRIGAYTVFAPRYQSRGRWGRPFLLVVPNDTTTEVETALDAVVRTSDWTPGDGLDRAVRIAVACLGIVFFGTAGGLAVIADNAASLVVYPAAIVGLFGVTLLLLAIRG